MLEAESFHAYVNERPDADWNTCGQAAIASIVDYHALDPFGLERVEEWNGRHYWDDGKAIDSVKEAGFGPDVVFGWGTTGGRVRDALNHFGLHAQVGHSGWFSAGWVELWESLKAYVSAGLPAPVMIDLGAIGGPSFGVHWAIAYRIAEGRVYLANCWWNPCPEEDDFLRAWHCHFLPFGFNHCGSSSSRRYGYRSRPSRRAALFFSTSSSLSPSPISSNSDRIRPGSSIG